MDNILNMIEIIYKRKVLIESLTSSKNIFPLKWAAMSCWIDSVLMVLLAFPSKPILDGIINSENIDIKKIKKENRDRITCPDEKIQVIHQNLRQLYYDMHKSECYGSNLWKVMDDCNLAIIYGQFGTTKALFENLQKIYPDVFITKIIDLEITETIMNKIKQHMQYFEKNKLLGIAVPNTFIVDVIGLDDKSIEIKNNREKDIELFDDTTIGIYKFKLLGVVYFISTGHIRSFIRNDKNEWYDYDGMNHIYKNYGNFRNALPKIIKNMKLITDGESFLIYEIQ